MGKPGGSFPFTTWGAWERAVETHNKSLPLTSPNSARDRGRKRHLGTGACLDAVPGVGTSGERHGRRMQFCIYETRRSYFSVANYSWICRLLNTAFFFPVPCSFLSIIRNTQRITWKSRGKCQLYFTHFDILWFAFIWKAKSEKQLRNLMLSGWCFHKHCFVVVFRCAEFFTSVQTQIWPVFRRCSWRPQKGL